MMIQNHVIAGLVISQMTSNPVLGISASFLSHFVLDLFPHPTQEMKIMFQSPLASRRDKVTLAFMTSFGVLITGFVLYLAIQNNVGWYGWACMIAANLVDIFSQGLPLLNNKRLNIKVDHPYKLISNPYVNIVLNQLFTFLGLIYLIRQLFNVVKIV